MYTLWRVGVHELAELNAPDFGWNQFWRHPMNGDSSGALFYYRDKLSLHFRQYSFILRLTLAGLLF